MNIAHALNVAIAVALPFAASATSATAQGVMPPGPSPRVDQTFAAWDSNHDGMLSLEEFRAGVRGSETALVEQRLHAQFNAVDKNHDGAIDADEYGALLLVKRAGSAAPPLSAFDANKDQKLNFAEYTDLVRKLADRPARPATPPPAR